MIVIKRLSEIDFADGREVVATIGNFDGLHRGHQAIMKRVTGRARQRDGWAAVISFHPHPLRVIRPQNAPRLMLTSAQKAALLEAMGIDVFVMIPFDASLADMPAEAFIREILVDGVGVREIYVGPDFRFGRGRAGDVALLAKLGEELGFSAEGIAPVMDQGQRISASAIRDLLTAGDADQAARLLGRPFTLVGTIVHGEGRGGSLLVPTANLAPENQFLPARGVYVTRTLWSGKEILGLTNIGIRPTFGYQRIVVETHLMEFRGNLYGERVELQILHRLREERKFSSAAELKEQIERDIEDFSAWRREAPTDDA